MLPLEIILTKRSSRNAKAMYKGGRGSDGGGNRNYSCYKDTTNGFILTKSYKSAFTEAEWMGPPGSGMHEDETAQQARCIQRGRRASAQFQTSVILGVYEWTFLFN